MNATSLSDYLRRIFQAGPPPNGWTDCQRLLLALLGFGERVTRRRRDVSGNEAVKIISLQDLRELVWSFVAQFPVRLEWSEECEQQVREILKTLSPREEEIVRMSYGIDLPRSYTFDEIAKRFSVSRSRIGQIRAKALRRLRQPSRLNRIRGLMGRNELVLDLSAQIRDREYERDQLLKEVNKLRGDLSLTQVKGPEAILDARRTKANLSRSIEELELSMRAYNCLKNAEIKTVGELVRKTDGEMLRIKYLGRNVLNELKEILAEMGLAFGMKLD